MTHRRVHAPPVLDFASIRAEVGVVVPFDDAVLAAAAEAAAADRAARDRIDRTDLDLVTIDPAGSTDLDQALAVERRSDGWRVRYAIADVAAWVEPGGALDDAARARTQTYYSPDARAPLHPPVLGEAAASLLPDGPRPALLWTIDVASDGTTTDIGLERATVRSRAQLTYGDVQRSIDEGDAPAPVVELAGLGPALLADARRRGAIELGLPEQDVVADGDERGRSCGAPTSPSSAGTPRCRCSPAAPPWLMLEGGVGVLRTLPDPDPDTFRASPRRTLGVRWDHGEHPGAVLARLDVSRPAHAAFADLAAELLRGAAYTTFRGRPPVDPGHAGVGAPYAHVTAPLRRLVDRFASEACLSLVRGGRPPAWVDDALDPLPDLMAEGDRRGRALERAVVDATEAFVLADRVGHVFPASVLESGPRSGTVVLDHPPVQARCDAADLPLGGTVRVRCTEADVARRRVRFERVS
ncbi:MAG: RNB domain-containing ribonuclease [Acidimicrobiales bacterium]